MWHAHGNNNNFLSSLNGILLRYNHLEFLGDTGRIIDDDPMIFWKIKANFHIFNVTINQLIKSKINRYEDCLTKVKHLYIIIG